MFDVAGILISIFISTSEGLCTFPPDLRGNWISADRGVLTFTSSGLSNYHIQLSVAVSTVDFNCDTLQNDQYYLRGVSSFSVFGYAVRPHICLEFQNITSDKFYYYIATNVEVTVGERIYVRSDSNTVTHGDVCNRQRPYEVGSYIMLIREGYQANSLAITCPRDVWRTFENVHMATVDGFSSCSGSRLDVCTDKRKMNFTYNACSQSLTFSGGGVWYCLYYTSYGSTTYLAALNLDSALVAGQTYRMVCYTSKWEGSKLRTTVYPGSCRDNQTDTTVVSPGVVMAMTDVSVNCDLEDGFDLVPFYIGAIAFALLIFGCVGVCINYKHYKNADKPNKIHTINVKEKQPHRESTSGIFSCSSTSIDEMDFRDTSTPVQKRDKITSPPTSLTGILQPYYSSHINRPHNNIYDDIHYTYLGERHLKKTPHTETSDDFYRNYQYFYNQVPSSHVHKKQKTLNDATKKEEYPKMKTSTTNSKRSHHSPGVLLETKNVYKGQFKTTAKSNKEQSDQSSTSTHKVDVNGPSARGRGHVTNTVHYFDRKIPLFWR